MTMRRLFILIADDNEDLATGLSILLKLFGFEVTTVNNGQDALTAAQLRAPDVLLLDIGLPGLDGFQVARHFRTQERLKNVHIIGISGYSPEMVADQSTMADFNHYLVKPVDFGTLLPLIHQLN